MTRISGYDLVACPSCGHVHRRTSYSSISIYAPESPSNSRVCRGCRKTFELEEFKKVGFLDRFSEEEKAERYAWTLYTLRQGPRPDVKLQPPFLRRCCLAVKAIFTPKVPKPWEKYPPLA